jgi:hypothetical protein
MNRSIFQTRKQKNSLEYKIIFCCGFINKFIGVFNIKLNDLNNLQIKSSGSKVFKEFKSQINHTQVEFENIGGLSNKIHKTFLSCNTTKPNEGFYEQIGKIKHKGKIEDQFINFKHQLIFDKSSSSIIEYNSIDKILDTSNEIDILLRQSNKIPILEEKLNFIQNSFENCVTHSHKIADCYHILSINSYRISNGIFDTILTYNVL